LSPLRSDVPVFVLCGGLGTRFREETEARPKPMVTIGNHPIVWHILRKYSQHGFKRFVLCLGYKAEVIKSYFLNYASMNSDFTVELMTNNATVHSIDHDQDWKVTLAYTGELTMTGARVAKAASKYLGDAQHFAVTYGDGLTDANLADEYEFHLREGRVGTLLGVNPPSRFGELKLDGAKVQQFSEKPDFHDQWINGGYFFFSRQFVLSRRRRDVRPRAAAVDPAGRAGTAEHVPASRVLGVHGYAARQGVPREVVGVRGMPLGGVSSSDEQ